MAQSTELFSDDWCVNHFDYISPDLADNLPETMNRMRALAPVAHSDRHDGYWIVSDYDHVVDVARNTDVFSSAHGLNILPTKGVIRNLPVECDPPEGRLYKNLTTPYFTPQFLLQYEAETRELVRGMIDEFVEKGSAEFMDEFARPFPSQMFFRYVVGAPVDEVDKVADMASTASTPGHPAAGENWMGLYQWIKAFIAARREMEPRGDVVDGVMRSEVEGRPITEDEIIGTIQLLMLGGLETTAGVLGQIFIRFCREPEIPALLREKPELIPKAVRELLRLDGSFVAVGRTAIKDFEIDGHQVRNGDKMLIHWGSANRDDKEFENPHTFDLDREHNRHVAFGLGPHRCTGSNLAIQNLKIALEELLPRLHDIRLQDGAELHYHAALTRSPLSVPITFTPGSRTNR